GDELGVVSEGFAFGADGAGFGLAGELGGFGLGLGFGDARLGGALCLSDDDLGLDALLLELLAAALHLDLGHHARLHALFVGAAEGDVFHLYGLDDDDGGVDGFDDLVVDLLVEAGALLDGFDGVELPEDGLGELVDAPVDEAGDDAFLTAVLGVNL